jgi:hypothetical protein
MNRLESLSGIGQKELEELTLESLPTQIQITEYAKSKAYKVNELVKEQYKSSYEWYGFTIAHIDNPDLIVDIGIGKNADNQLAYTKIGSEAIEEYQSSLEDGLVINGWIHSHGDLGYQHFSGTDDKNQITVLNYVTTLLRKPIRKKEVDVKDLSLLIEGEYQKSDLKKGTVSIVTDKPISSARFYETIMGGFSYAIVIGDEGWHEQEIYHKERSMISGKENLFKVTPESISVVKTDDYLTRKEINALKKEVKEKITPPSYIGYNYGFSWYEKHFGSGYSGLGYWNKSKTKTKTKSKKRTTKK